MPRKEMADELRELRKTAGTKPVSKMKLFEISAEIERLKNIRATTPAVASYSGSKDTVNIGSSVADVKESKAKGFPTRPEKTEKAKMSKGVVPKEKKSEMKPVVEKKKMTTKMTEAKPVKKMARSKKVAEVAESGSDYE
jgi:hypothetical protein